MVDEIARASEKESRGLDCRESEGRGEGGRSTRGEPCLSCDQVLTEVKERVQNARNSEFYNMGKKRTD